MFYSNLAFGSSPRFTRSDVAGAHLMNMSKWLSLNEEQRLSLSLAMHIRNELEDFHVEHVSDREMPELNSAIRCAIYEFLTEMDEQKLGWLAMMVPDYWEVPGNDPKPKFFGEYLWEGKPVPKQPISPDSDSDIESSTK